MGVSATHRTHVVTLKGGQRFRAKCQCGWSARATVRYVDAVIDGELHEKWSKMRAEGKL